MARITKASVANISKRMVLKGERGSEGGKEGERKRKRGARREKRDER